MAGTAGRARVAASHSAMRVRARSASAKRRARLSLFSRPLSGGKKAQVTFAGWKSALVAFWRCATSAPWAVSGGTGTGSSPAMTRAAARRDEPARRRLDVAFGTGDLSGEPDRRMSPQTQIRGQQAGTVDERVAVHHAEAKPLGALQARQLPERFSLRAPGKPCLKTDQVQRGPGRVLLP